MTESDEPRPAALPAPAALAWAWLERSPQLLALTDSQGRIGWANAAFAQATGLALTAQPLLALAPPDWQRGAAHQTLQRLLSEGTDATADTCLRTARGEPLWVRLHVAHWEQQRLWTLHDQSGERALAEQAQHQSELLDIAQEFGRLGVWEREIPSGAGRWDRHVFGFWGMDPNGQTPDYAVAAARLHEDDRTSEYLASTARAGRYAQRYRVVRPDGTLRRIHSQWEVKNGPDGTPCRAVGVMVDDTETYEQARALDATTAQLKLAVELASVLLWRHDLKTGRLHYNEHGYRVLGLRADPLGLTLEEACAQVHRDDLARLSAAAEHALKVHEPVDVEVRHRDAHGQWRYLLVRRVVERDACGAPVAFVGVTLDVTEQVQHSRHAEQLARRLEAAATAARLGIWVMNLANGHTQWNEQMYELFDLAGATRPPTLEVWIDRRVHPEDAARVGRITREYIADPHHDSFELEFRARRGDGSTRWMVLRADVDRDSVDTTRIFGIAMDVTERHEALEALHRASERAALIARQAGIGTWETDGEGLPTHWDEQMFHLRGLEPRRTAPSRAQRLAMVHPEDRLRVLDANPLSEDDGRPAAYEFRVRLPDGRYRWLASRSVAKRDATGRVVHRMGVNWDVTEGKSADLARQQALLAERESHAKSQFLSRMSHELRTPLNAVLGFTQLLQLEAHAAPASSQAHKLEHIRSAGEHLLTLINDVLDLSGLQAGTLRLELQPVPLRDAVVQALPLVEALARAHQVTLHATTLPGIALADPTRMRQVLLNLLTNAIKYNRAGGQVVVDASVLGGGVRLRVRDTGLGMHRDQLVHLFEPFNRLGRDTMGIDGSGIGLTIVKALVEGMGGNLEVSSELDRGTVFELMLQGAAHAAPAVAVPSEPNETAPAGPRAPRVGQLLYIEDNGVNVLLVQELIKSVPGLRMASAASGGEGVALAQALRPQVVLVDMQLPDFDGYEVLRRLRAAPDTAQMTCIALSANAMREDIERALACGFDDYWTKPIKFKPFLDALERLFPKRLAPTP